MTFTSLESLSPEPQAQIMRNLDASSTLRDHGSAQAQIPLSMIISLCKLIPSIGWFVQDYRRKSIEFLANFVTQLELKQDSWDLYSDLSAIEAGRIQRAFCRLETFRYLFAATEGAVIHSDYVGQARRFLNFYAPDEVEEIACIIDYLIRRLWDTFESVEDDAFQENSPSRPIRELDQQRSPHGWFSPAAKARHLLFMEYLVSQGLPFLRKVFESDGVRRAELVIPNSRVPEGYISDVLTPPVPSSFCLKISMPGRTMAKANL
ncbi:MAG: hypothetical protein Q9181_000868 [Wetmoreana brouardii]